MVTGLILLVAAASAWGLCVRAMTRPTASFDRTLAVDPGVIAAIIVPILPHSFDAIQSVAGHATLVAIIVFSGLAVLAVRRPSPVTVFVLPVAASLAFLESGSIVFIGVPVLSALSTSDAWRGWRWNRIAWSGVAVLIIARAFLFFDIEPLVGARDLAAAGDVGLVDRGVAAMRRLVLPVTEGGMLTDAARWNLCASVAGFIGLGVVWGHFAASRMRFPAVAFLALCLGALLIQSVRPELPPTMEDSRELLFAGLGLAGLLAVSFDGAARRGSTEWIVLAVLLYMAFTGGNIVKEHCAVREERSRSLEIEAIVTSIKERVPDRVERLVVLGAPDAPRGVPDISIPGRLRAPWSDRRLDIRVAEDGHYGRLPEELLIPGKHNLLCEWRPATMLTVRTRPKGWVLAPILGVPFELAGSGIRLTSPDPEAVIPLRRPNSIEEDYAFEFEVDPGFDLRPGEAFVFYGFYDGPRRPGGRDTLTTRRLRSSVLKRTVLPGGGARYIWRAAIRPAPGVDGVSLEHADLGLEGKKLWWTIGVARDAEHDEEKPHDDHSKHGSATDRFFPMRVAQTRRIRFVAER